MEHMPSPRERIHADTGDLTLETLMTSPLPARIDKIWVEFDFPGIQFPPKHVA
jgi:hypothetical protein